MSRGINISEKISIIIPIYNMQDYIERCLDSILAQVYTEFEVICVDDGSVDDSGSICEAYKAKDTRVKVYHIPNGGVSNARNFGLTVITGEWFTFVDADDWIEPDYLQILYDNAKENNCDVSACCFQRNNTYYVGYPKENVRTIVFPTFEECVHSFVCEKESLEGITCNKIYRTAVCGDIRFDTCIKVNEDCLYTYDVMERCRRACLSTAPLYHWFLRRDSASHSRATTCNFSAANVFLKLYDKTLSLEDTEVMQTLQKNYICEVLKVLVCVRYDKNDKTVQEAINRCKQWKKNALPLMGNKIKLKYMMAMHMPWIFRLVS